MATKSVAREDDVSATAGTKLATGADSGAWTAEGVTVATTALVTSDGREVVLEATCTFTFKGKSGNSTMTASSTLTLKPGSRTLHVGDVAPLVDGDRIQDVFDNTISVSSDALLRTG